MTLGVWYIHEGFLVWIVPSTYQFHEPIIWACISSFVHTYIYCLFDVSSHVYMCLCSWHHFLCMFFNSDLSIYMYLLDFALLLILWFSFMLLVIVCTCMLEPHHLIMYTCDYQSMLIDFILQTRWVVFWQPWTFMSRSKSLDRGVLPVADQSAQWKRGLAVVCLKPLFFQLPWSTHEILILLLVSIF